MENNAETNDHPLDSDSGPNTISEEFDTEMAEFATPHVGDVVGRTYTIEGVRGPRRYLARERRSGELFELRMFDWIGPMSRDYEALVRGAQTTSLVGHAQLSVISSVSACSTFGPFAVAELVPGTPLTDLLQSGRQSSVDEVVRFALEIGGALGAIHDVGIVGGLVDLKDIVLSEDNSWRLQGAGLPSAPDSVWMVRAPELDDPDSASMASDQWAFAAILYHMLTGAFPSTSEPRPAGRRRADVPDLLDEAIMRALSPDPTLRWSHMEGILQALQRAFYTWRRPSMVPMDAREVSRLLKLHPDVAQQEFSRDRTRQSVVVRVADLQSAKPRLSVSFRNIARLRREYRHNLAHGGLFVPTTEPPLVGAEVIVEIQVSQTERSVELGGVVANVEEGGDATPPGAGIIFGADGIEALLGFLREIGVTKGTRPSDSVVRVADFDASDLSAEELFLFSMTIGDCTVGHLRSECGTLPFDFDETLQSLIDAGGIVIEASQREGRDFRPARPARKRDLTVSGPLQFSREDVELLLEQVDFHEERKAFLAADALIERALLHLPDDGRLLHRKAMLHARGLNDLPGAKEAARRALEGDPKRREYREAVTWIEGLSEREAVRCIYSRVFPVTDVEFIGWDDSERCAWILTRSRLQPDRVRVLGIDVKNDTIVHSATEEDASHLHVVWDPVAHRGMSPVFWRGESRPAAISRDGEWWAFDRDPSGTRRGIWLGKANGCTWIEVATNAGATFGLSFAPTGGGIVWQTSDGDKTSVWVGTTNGGARAAYETSGSVHTSWDDDGNLIILDAHTGIVARIEDSGFRVLAEIEPGFSRAVNAPDAGGALLLYVDDDQTRGEWISLQGERLGGFQVNEILADAAVTENGLFVARGREGAMTGNLNTGEVRNIGGVRLCPGGFRRASWAGDVPFVMMRVRPSALELVSLDVALLHA